MQYSHYKYSTSEREIRSLLQYFSKRAPAILEIYLKLAQTSEKHEACFSVFQSEC